MSLQVTIIPCRTDNYSYMCIDSENNAFVVDPSEFLPVDIFIKENNLNLKYILNTHHHFDHIGGNIELKEKYDAKIVGSKIDKERIPGIDICLKEGEFFEFNGHKAEIIDIPGHTLGHIAFYIQSENIVFTGDTLFSLGCGRIFEGTPEMMFESLNKLKNLPDNTKVYCGHEYTLNNALFLESIIKDKDLSEKVKSLRELNEKQQPSIPTTIKAEKKINFFLRSNEESFKNYLNMSKANDLEVFTYLRHLKDTF
jgi:hydroxyacylglutathione hydrolase